MGALPRLILSLSLIAVSGCGAMFLEPTNLDGDSVFEIKPEQEVSFGLVSPNGAPVTQEAWLRSAGIGTVVVEEIVMDQDDHGVFTLVTDPTPCLLEDDDETPVELRFRPTNADQYNGRVVFLATVNGSRVEIARRLSGSGCTDVDGDGECVGTAQDGYEPTDTGDW